MSRITLVVRDLTTNYITLTRFQENIYALDDVSLTRLARPGE